MLEQETERIVSVSIGHFDRHVTHSVSYCVPLAGMR